MTFNSQDKKAQSIGGAVMAKRQRKAALVRYYADPVYCKACGDVIRVPEHVPPCHTRRKQFCNHKCSARYNSSRRKPKHTCIDCAKPIDSRAKRCAPCHRKTRASSLADGTDTKGDLFTRRKSYQSARNGIRRHAHKTFHEMGITSCQLCGYKKHVDAAHRKPVASFPDSATIAEIVAST